MSKSTLGKHIIEAILIVFSVLFALFINKTAESYKTENKKEIALESIHKELYRNSRVINRWLAQHNSVLGRLDSIVRGQNDSLKTEIAKHKYFNLAVLTNGQSLIDAMVISSAWESAKETGITSEFDYEVLQSLTRVYDMQSILTQNTIPNLLTGYFSRDTHKMEEVDLTLNLLYLQMQELVGHEILLARFYKESIDKIHKETHIKDKVFNDSLKTYVDR